MFPSICRSTSHFSILVPSYNPLIEQYARDVGAIGEAGAGLRPDRGKQEKMEVTSFTMRYLDCADPALQESEDGMLRPSRGRAEAGR